MARTYKIQQNSQNKQYYICVPKAVVETKGWDKGTTFLWRDGRDTDTLQLIKLEEKP